MDIYVLMIGIDFKSRLLMLEIRKKVQCNVMRQLLINMPSMKKKVICITAWIYDLSALTSLQFFSFQYYEMSYGLNVEMHKQVRRKL